MEDNSAARRTTFKLKNLESSLLLVTISKLAPVVEKRQLKCIKIKESAFQKISSYSIFCILNISRLMNIVASFYQKFIAKYNGTCKKLVNIPGIRIFKESSKL